MNSVVVGVADCRISTSTDVVLVTYALGSCIALMIHDPVAKVGGLLHYMLPESSLDQQKAHQNPFMFADTGIPLLFRSAYEQGADKRRLVVWAAGGAQVMDQAAFLISASGIIWRCARSSGRLGCSCIARKWGEPLRERSVCRWAAGGFCCAGRERTNGRWRCPLIRRKEFEMAYNVLIVDDSPAMRSFVRRALELSGIPVGECLEAGDGREALEVLRTQWVDVVLTDLNMPTMDGEQFVRRMEADESLRPIPVLVVSTDRTDQRVQQMLTLDARGYVTKPFLPETLREELERVLGVIHGSQ